MTEDESKTRWCPMYRYNSGTNTSTDNREGTYSAPFLQSPHCIGSECMAWRWEMTDVSSRNSFKDGYCGLAGKP